MDFQLRDVFNPKVVDQIAQQIHSVYPQFQIADFKKYVLDSLAKLSFGDRNNLIVDALAGNLPTDFPTSAAILINSLGPEIQEPEITGYDGFYVLPLSSFISRFGQAHFDISIHALFEMTKRFSSEGPIRVFIRKYPKEILGRLHEWTTHPNPHVRRLVSEGTRPRLPLASPLKAFQKDPEPIFRLLAKLIDDPILFVRRSVANNLNDIAKDNPDQVVKFLNQYTHNLTKEREWVIKHATRTLAKQGHPAALKLLGFDPDINIQLEPINLTDSIIRIGNKLKFQSTITNPHQTEVHLMIDFVIYFMKANGKLKPKVFKITQKTLKPKQGYLIHKSFEFLQRSTRKLYPGKHQVSLQINGIEYPAKEFELIE